MILKEAFRYQNYLNGLLSSAEGYLYYTDNVTNKKQEHLRKLINPDAENETINLPKRSDIEHEPNEIIAFAIDILNEKEKLSKAIDKAKASSEINIDSSVAINKQKQNFISVLNQISNIKSSEKVVKGTAYKFNADGNQVPYNYDIKEVTTIDFDRNKVKGIIKKLRNESDEVSNILDKIQIELDVNYSPIYDLNDSFEDALTTWKSLQ